MSDQKKARTSETTSEVKIGNKVYILERHFTSTRRLEDAVYAVLRNEANRQVRNNH